MIQTAYAMSATLNGNGNGNGHGKPSLIRQLEKKAAQKQALSLPKAIKSSWVIFQNSEGEDLGGTVIRMSRRSVFFELLNPATLPRYSEVLAGFNIILNDEIIYSGHATVRNLIIVGTKVVCETVTRDSEWSELDLESAIKADQWIADYFQKFLKDWQKTQKVSAGFKVVVADLHAFLRDLRLWLERLELNIQSLDEKLRTDFERVTIDKLRPNIVASIDSFIDQFESIVCKLDDQDHPTHYAYLRQQLHPLVLDSPFANRAFNKPLGYAGDYQMVDMMIRSPYEGETLFAKLINIWLLGQSPAQAHRNRVDHLERKLVEETLRMKSRGQTAKIFNLGCGPAAEIQRFFKKQHVCSSANFTLVDFNEETLQHLRQKLEFINHKLPEPVEYRLVRKSVSHILKEGGRPGENAQTEKYDYIYCAGLFDYLSDNICKQLMNIFYSMLAPGGLLLATNATDVLNGLRPFRYSMEYILDWHLIYRDKNQFAALAPDLADGEEVQVLVEGTGANLFLEVRKPKHG